MADYGGTTVGDLEAGVGGFRIFVSVQGLFPPEYVAVKL